MDFSNYTDAPVGLAVALANTLDPITGEDLLADLDGLRAFLAEVPKEWREQWVDLNERDLTAVRRLRDGIRRVFETDDVEQAVAELNRELTSSGAVPRVSAHTGIDPHFHFESTRRGVGRWLGAITAMGLATVVCDYGIDRLGVCSSETCADVYVDTSRNRSRRHCSVTCGTRENVAAFRRRRASRKRVTKQPPDV
jgi:predicted RNA-binding Zn ribbon-like protein